MNKSTIFCALATALLSLGATAQTINYKGESVVLGPHAFLVDGSLQTSSKYSFRTFNEAMAAITDGTTSDPMRVYIAPGVYWIDDPDDPAVRRNPDGSTPIGIEISCQSLQLLGMCEDAQDVVLGSARGQSQGSYGNFTNFSFHGDNLVVKDLTMGNYCNIDLVYPRDPSLNRPKRNSAITQAQLAFCDGDRIYAENVRFVSRLNLTPFCGAKRLLFVGCHFECTDDSLAQTGVYLGCDVDMWGRQPFGSVSRYGTVWLNSDLKVCHSEPVQAVSKGVGRHSLIDVRYHSVNRQIYLAWTFRPEEWLRCYQYDVTLNGQPAFVGAAKPYNTICLEQKSQLGAYRLLKDDGSVLYNTYNLLRGEDDWDPQGIKSEVLAIGVRDGRDYTNVPTCLDIDKWTADIQTGEEPLELSAQLYRHVGYELNNQKIMWRVQPGFEKYVRLSTAQGAKCKLTATNHEDKTVTFDVIAYTQEGLECATELTVRPDFLPAPTFTKTPSIRIEGGVAKVDYSLDLAGRADESLVTWYRCKNRKGEGAVKVAVSRQNTPLTSYNLTREDAGYYICASVEPKHLRSEAGEAFKAISKSAVKPAGVGVTKTIGTEFVNFPVDNQTAIKPGFWTVDAFKPEDTADYSWSVDLSKECWIYGTGINGAKGFGILPVQQGARLRYTPLPGKYGDMSLTWKIDPAKDGGQGFASARQQYLDLFIKFDTKTLTGYALRVIRTTKYANAVDVLLVRYTDGHVEPISESTTVDCFLTGCELSVKVEGDTLSASVGGPGRIIDLAGDKNVKHSASLSAKITPNQFGGFGLQHTSTVGSESRILVHYLKAEWK